MTANALERIRQGASEMISEPELKEKLGSSRSLVIKAGFDPTAPDLHLGHTVLLRKLRHFQDLGHKVVFLIGDATALVGDPSGQSKTRKSMTWEQVDANARTYKDQVGKLLATDNPALFDIRFNSEWFGRSGRMVGARFGIDEFVDLASKYTVARLIERDDFQKRLKAGQEVSFLELFYPLMQGYDSVMLRADVELGGTDQKFNLLVGRDLQRSYEQPPQVVITLPLLEGTDGVQKMSKSLGNHVGISEPPASIFGKLMSIPDTLILKYFALLTDIDSARLSAVEAGMKDRSLNPRDAKSELAATLVRMYHGAQAADAAKAEFFKVFSRREMPTEMAELKIQAAADGTVNLIELMVAQGLVKTKNEARRLLSQGGVKLGGEKAAASACKLEAGEHVLQVGSRPGQFRKLVVSKS